MRTLQHVLFTGLCVLVAGLAQGQGLAYPTKPVRMIVTGAPGTGPDILVRVLNARLTEIWRQPVVVENIPGAGGNIGVERAARAPNDGYTILVGFASAFTVYPLIMRKLPYDPIKDFEPITLLVKLPNILAVHPSVPAKSVRELIAYARERPGKLRYGSAGIGTTAHLSIELLNNMAAVKLVDVPYSSSATMVNEAIGGQFEVISHSASVLLPHVRSGALRVLAITSLKRVTYAPDIPTVSEEGLPGFEMTNWYGLFAPAATPRGVIDKVHSDVAKMLSLPDVRQRIQAMANDPVGSGPDEFAAYIKAEVSTWAKVLKEAGVKPQ